MSDTENWMFAIRHKPDGPVSLFVNTEYRDSGAAPDSSRSSATRIRVPFNNPSEDGLGETSEADSLFDLVDRLVPKLASEASATFIGRVRGGGNASFWFYSPKDQRATIERLANHALGNRSIAVEHRSDPEWSMYHSLLPTPGESRLTLDYQVVQVLEENGDPLTPKRDVRHHIYFPDRGGADTFAQRIAPDGFKIEIEPSDGQWLVCAARDDSVEHPQISSITGPLADLAAQLGGDYDGWEAMLVKPKKGLLGRLFKK